MNCNHIHLVAVASGLAFTSPALLAHDLIRQETINTAIGETAVAPDFIDRGPHEPDPSDLRERSDVNLDGIVDVGDLLEVIAHWGQCPAWSELSCIGDVDASFYVDAADLTTILANWGETIPHD